MKVYCISVCDERTGFSIATDMLPFELLSYAKATYGSSSIITYMFDISAKEFQKWQIEGAPVVLHQRQ